MTVGVRVRQHRRLDASSPLDPRLLVRLARPCTPRSRRPFECCHAVTNRCHLAGQTTDTEVSTHKGLLTSPLYRPGAEPATAHTPHGARRSGAAAPRKAGETLVS